MGTGQSGRYLNTSGSARKVSDFALVHSNEGFLTKPTKKGDRLRLKSGGHGQAGMDLLYRYGIRYNVVKTYPNGVRVGNVPDHKNKKKRFGISQAWFPQNWTDRDIRRAGEHVAGLKMNRHKPDGTTIIGIYKGVKVGVIKTNGIIGTVFPDLDQRDALKKRRKRK